MAHRPCRRLPVGACARGMRCFRGAQGRRRLRLPGDAFHQSKRPEGGRHVATQPHQPARLDRGTSPSAEAAGRQRRHLERRLPRHGRRRTQPPQRLSHQSRRGTVLPGRGRHRPARSSRTASRATCRSGRASCSCCRPACRTRRSGRPTPSAWSSSSPKYRPEPHHLRWYCRGCGHVLHDAEFQPVDLGKQIKAMIEEFNGSTSSCGPASSAGQVFARCRTGT